MKLIFLDMDGVMNSMQSHYYYHDFLGIEHNWANKFAPEKDARFELYEDEICPMAICNLRHLLRDHPDIRIVISSTWRYGRSTEWFNQLFSYIGITGDTKCFGCDGVGHLFNYHNGKSEKANDCKTCGGTGILKCPIGNSKLVIGRTPVLDDSGKSVDRGFEIQEWLNNFTKDNYVDNFVILDDDSDMGPYLKTENFIQTDARVGFDYLKMLEANKLLKKESNNVG
jgi:hypothetical protein